jgi:peptide/nickel transport system ATP-binding protein
MSATPILSVQDLGVSFRTAEGWTPAVRDLSFTLSARETLAIVGESGSGKSVTALSLMRLLPSANSRVSGRALLAGRDLLALSEEEMHHVRGNEIAMIFQEPMTSLNPVLTIGDQITEVPLWHRDMDRRAHHGPRCDRPGADPRSHPLAPGRVRHGRAVHHT